jgi:hypothetical protein
MYRRIILVGHSMGAALIRLAIWEEYKRIHGRTSSTAGPASPLLEAELRLFAPALIGAQPAGLLGLLVRLPLFGEKVGMLLAGYLGPVGQLLDPENRQILEDLRAYTEDAAEENRNVSALEAKVLWGTDEKLLTAWQYKWDHAEFVQGRNHTDLCKPTSTYTKPLEFVIHEHASANSV